MKWKLWLNIITLGALGLIIFFAWHDIVTAFGHMHELNPGLLLLMIPIQFFVFFAQGKLFARFFKTAKAKLSAGEMFKAMLELNFVNHIFPSGGVSGFSYLTLRLKPLGVSTAKSTLAHLAKIGTCFVGYIALLIVAVIALSVQDRISGLMVLVVSAVTFCIIFAAVIVMFVIGSEQRIAWFSGGLTRKLNRLIHIFRPKSPQVIKPESVAATFLELHKDYAILRADKRSMLRIFMWAVVVDLAEVVLLYLVFMAHGAWVNPGAVIVAYVIANIAGFIAILPGGIGVFEPLMTAVFISAGIPAGLALSATLVFRVVTLLLTLLTGYVLYQKTVHKFGNAGLSGQRTHSGR